MIECRSTARTKRGAKIERSDPNSPYALFRSLSYELKTSALIRIFDLHVYLESRGLVAEDFYDGCILYNFTTDEVWVCDIAHYHRGGFSLERERKLGSSRFMATEEFVRGSTIDTRTTVYNLGRAAIIFLANGENEESAWEGSIHLFRIIEGAVQVQPADRFSSVEDLHHAWMKAVYRQRSGE